MTSGGTLHHNCGAEESKREKGVHMSSISTRTRRSSDLIRIVGALLLSVGLAALPLLAQSYYGVVRGLVVDQNGGVLVTAKVTLVNEGTSEQRATTTSSNGEYVFNEVVPATYTVVCEHPGFKRFERKGIVIAFMKPGISS